MKVFLLFVLIIVLYILIIGEYIYKTYLEKKKNHYLKHHHNQYNKTNAVSCDIHSCGALDPVSDPKYNMQQIVKQSILLEEHLTNKNKRCRDCITKHFLHIIGLAEEAQMLATNDIDKYPLINECVIMYNELFEKWTKGCKDPNEHIILSCSNKLRLMRKKLIIIYYFDEKYKIDEKDNKI